jgi:hypothetical protein
VYISEYRSKKGSKGILVGAKIGPAPTRGGKYNRALRELKQSPSDTKMAL